MCKNNIAYLCFLVSAEGVKQNPVKTKPICDYPVPKDDEAMRQFLETGSYYKRFIQAYAGRAKTLQRSFLHAVKFVWGNKQQKALEDIKLAITKTTLIRHSDFTKPFYIDCDASIVDFGAALHQRNAHNREYPVTSASRTLRPKERTRTITELEVLAVLWALETFCKYIEGSRTLAQIDHSLQLLFRINVKTSASFARWVLRLQDFTFDL